MIWPFTKRNLSYHLNKISNQNQDWLVFSHNQAGLERPNLLLETRSDEASYKLQWTSLNQKMRIDLFSEKHLYGILVNQESAQSFMLYTHLQLKTGLDKLKTLSLENAGAVTAIDLTQEGRAIEWLRVSLKVLKDALESCLNDDSKIVTARLYLGKESKGSQPVFRAIIFNLDITCVFDPEGVMGVVVFDDKNMSHGSNQKPSLEARFKGLKPAVLDELITLSATLMKAVEGKSLKFL